MNCVNRNSRWQIFSKIQKSCFEIKSKQAFAPEIEQVMRLRSTYLLSIAQMLHALRVIS